MNTQRRRARSANTIFAILSIITALKPASALSLEGLGFLNPRNVASSRYSVPRWSQHVRRDESEAGYDDPRANGGSLLTVSNRIRFES